MKAPRIVLRRARYWLWANTRQEPPVRRLLGQEEELHAAVEQLRASKAAAADDNNPHLPITTVHRPAIYVDADGITWVRDRWGERPLGYNNATPAGGLPPAISAPAGVPIVEEKE